MTCADCVYCESIDYGYSNYTVEGTTVNCLCGKNPDFPIDRFWGEEPALKFAEKCSDFLEGEGPYYYVEDQYDEGEE